MALSAEDHEADISGHHNNGSAPGQGDPLGGAVTRLDNMTNKIKNILSGKPFTAEQKAAALKAIAAWDASDAEQRKLPLVSDDGGTLSDADQVPADGFERRRRMSIGLLGELGVREEVCGWYEWQAHVNWAGFSLDKEEAEVSVTGEYPTLCLHYRVRVPDKSAVEDFLADYRVRRLSLTVKSIEQLAETLEDRRITLEGMVEASAFELTKVTSSLISAAYEVLGKFEQRSEVRIPDSCVRGVIETNPVQRAAHREDRPTQPPKAPLVELNGRTEFQRDTFIARAMLAPYAVQWRDGDGLGLLSDGSDVVHGMDSDIAVTLADGAPHLDHIRWLLNQVTDMHVAAQSLNAKDRYTGERLPYDMVERMTPPEDIRRQMADNLAALSEMMQHMVDDINAAQAAIAATLPRPKAKASRVKRANRGRKA